MASPGIAWIDLRPSAERRRWLLAAALLCAALAALCLARAAIEPTAGLLLTAVAAAGGAALAARQRRRPDAPGALHVDADGCIWQRRAAADGGAQSRPVARRLRPRYSGARFVTLGAAAGTLVVWHDSLPAAHFRRLSAYARWQRDRSAARPPAAPDPRHI